MKTQNKAVCRTMTQHWMKQNTTEDGPVQRTPVLERARGDGLTGSSNRTREYLDERSNTRQDKKWLDF